MLTANSARSRWLTLSLGFGISLISGWLIVRDVDLSRFNRALANADLQWTLVALVLLGVTFFGRVQRWRTVLYPIKYRVSDVIGAQLIGQVLNFLLPFRIGDITRSILVGRKPDSSFERVLGSVVIEKALDWIALTVMLLGIALTSPLPDWLVVPIQSACAGASLP
jgi:uncharacterized membrane protein YbhN (UPF0104 family)